MSINTVLGLSAALLVSVSMGVSAAEGDMAQSRTQEQVRKELNLQLPESDQAQSRVREQEMKQKMEQKMEQSQNKVQNQNQNRTSVHSAMDNAGSAAMVRQGMMQQNMMNRPMRGNR